MLLAASAKFQGVDESSNRVTKSLITRWKVPFPRQNRPTGKKWTEDRTVRPWDLEHDIISGLNPV